MYVFHVQQFVPDEEDEEKPRNAGYFKEKREPIWVTCVGYWLEKKRIRSYKKEERREISENVRTISNAAKHPADIRGIFLNCQCSFSFFYTSEKMESYMELASRAIGCHHQHAFMFVRVCVWVSVDFFRWKENRFNFLKKIKIITNE